MSVRILVVCEGTTEELFVNEMIAPIFPGGQLDIRATRLVTSPGHRGGMLSWDGVRRQMVRLCREQPSRWITTLFDYYKLPSTFPARALPSSDPLRHAADIEQGMKRDIGHDNIHPFIQVHEFESLLFSDPAGFETYAGSAVGSILMEEARNFSSPELINDSPQTAPSKRIARAWPAYDKTDVAIIMAMEIGLPRMRARCQHFDTWLTWLESLA